MGTQTDETKVCCDVIIINIIDAIASLFTLISDFMMFHSLEDESNANSGRETDDLTTRRATPGLGYTAPAKSSSVLAFKPRTIKK